MTQTEIRQKMRADVKTALENMARRMEHEVPESGDFAPVFEFFDNPNPQTEDYVGRYGMQIYKMPSCVVEDPTKRYMEAAAYFPGGEYKMDIVVAYGTKDEIRKKLTQPEFLDKAIKDFETLEEWVRIA